MKKILLAVAALMLVGAGCGGPPCVKSHGVPHHQDAYDDIQTQAVMVGGSMHMIPMPQHHPARDWTETVCDEYGPETK